MVNDNLRFLSLPFGRLELDYYFLLATWTFRHSFHLSPLSRAEHNPGKESQPRDPDYSHGAPRDGLIMVEVAGHDLPSVLPTSMLLAPSVLFMFPLYPLNKLWPHFP